MEHPEAFWKEELPSVRRLPVAHQLRRYTCTDTAHMDQRKVGLEARGPTCLLALRCQALRRRVDELPGRGCCPHGRHALVLTGRDSAGGWRTAAKRQHKLDELLLQGRIPQRKTST